MADQSRLDFLEGRVEEQSRNWERLFAEFGRVDQRLDALGIGLSSRIDAVDQALSNRIDALDHKFDSKIDSRIDGLRAELATQFRWTIGIMTALITGVLAAILAQ